MMTANRASGASRLETVAAVAALRQAFQAMTTATEAEQRAFAAAAQTIIGGNQTEKVFN